jgi:DNA modification methylase
VGLRTWNSALALQADGWVLSSDIIWSKVNPMPESVTDRPTKAHEYIFLLTKKPRYWYDQDVIKEPANYDGRKDTVMKGGIKQKDIPGQSPNTMFINGAERWPNKTKDGLPARNKRTVWEADSPAEILSYLADNHPKVYTDVIDKLSQKSDIWNVPTKPYKEAHFACFPPKLIEPCILAGCPSRVCVECGKPWVRVVKKIKGEPDSFNGSSFNRGKTNVSQSVLSKVGVKDRTVEIIDQGFSPQCQCCPLPANKEATKPGIVLDPFFGSGTTGQVALEHKRNYLGIELNPEYIEMAEKRINQTQPRLFIV